MASKVSLGSSLSRLSVIFKQWLMILNDSTFDNCYEDHDFRYYEREHSDFGQK